MSSVVERTSSALTDGGEAVSVWVTATAAWELSLCRVRTSFLDQFGQKALRTLLLPCTSVPWPGGTMKGHAPIATLVLVGCSAPMAGAQGLSYWNEE